MPLVHDYVEVNLGGIKQLLDRFIMFLVTQL